MYIFLALQRRKRCAVSKVHIKTVTRDEMSENNTKAKFKNKPSETKIENRLFLSIGDRLFTMILVGALAIGVCLLVYPSFADYWNSIHQTRTVMNYAEAVANMDAEEYERILGEARAYNAQLAERGINWVMTDEERVAYENQLNVGGQGVIGYIRIQKIDVMLPVYHGTAEEILQTSIGHLEQSSFPISGESVHSMLSGHRGLPSAKLFSDLDKMKEGDTFTVTVLNETTTYEVDHVWIVEPADLSHLDIESGKDFCTLITCTPYGINTHRLLVRAHRIENANGSAMVVADAIQIQPVFIAPFLAIPLLLLLLGYMLVSTAVKNRKSRDLKAAYLEEHGLTETIEEIDDQDDIIDAVKRFFEKRNR